MLAWRKTQVESGDQQDGAAGGGSPGSNLANENFWVVSLSLVHCSTFAAFDYCIPRWSTLPYYKYIPFRTTLPHQSSSIHSCTRISLCALSFHVSVLYLSLLLLTRTSRNLLSVLSIITDHRFVTWQVNFGALFSTSYEHFSDLMCTLKNTVLYNVCSFILRLCQGTGSDLCL